MNRSDFERLRTVLRAEQVAAPFSVLGEIAAAYAHAEANGDREGRLRARDLIIRCIERAEAFTEQAELLDTLIARAGLFPYLEDPDRLELIDRLVYEAHRPLADPADRELVFHGVQAEVYAPHGRRVGRTDRSDELRQRASSSTPSSPRAVSPTSL